MRESATRFKRAGHVMPDGNTRHTVHFDPHPLYAVRGEGCRIWDVDGREFLDFVNNYSSLIHGHCHPKIVAAIRRQIGELISVGMPTEQEILLSELLCRRVGSAGEIRFANSGTEAVMLAIKVARAFTGRPKIAKLEGAYHGTYDSAEISQAPTPETWGPADHPASLPTAHGTPMNVVANTIVLPLDDTDAARAILSRHADELAAVVIDAAPSHVAYTQVSPEFLKMVREFTRASGSLFILDEVYSFRFAWGGAQERFGISPDLTVLGKIIGGGLPIGAIAGPSQTLSVFRHRAGAPRLPHGGTFNANPVSMTAGLAAMELFDRDEINRLEILGERLRARLNECIVLSGAPAQVTGLASVAAIVFKENELRSYRDLYLLPEEKRRLVEFHRGMLESGVLIDSRGTMILSTPMSENEIDVLADRALAVLRRLG